MLKVTRTLAAAAATLMSVALAASSAIGVGATTVHSSGANVQKTSVAQYTNIAASSSLHTFYVLSVEKSGSLHCTGACLSVWKPYLVSKSVSTIVVGAGVKDHVGFVKRSSTMKQVTLNGYPIYTYSADHGAKEVGGEGVAADGGTWYLVSATTTSATATAVKPKDLLTLTTAGSFANVLADPQSYSLYVLSNESGGTLHCTGACLSIWFPVLVPSSTTSVLVQKGIKGTIGFVARGNAMSQVTLNKFPVYRYAGDAGPSQANGQGIAADGGTWNLANGVATTTGTTELH